MTATMTKELHVAVGVDLPVDYVTQVAAILAQRRKGKTYCAAVIAEELYAAGQPWVALDPTGAWWGLRSSSDGQHPGIPVVVIGGQHGDLPLEAGAGSFVADLVLDYPGWYVIDLSLLEGRVAEREFATAFAQRLHRRKMQPGMDFPLHLFVDEADLFLPQEKETKADVPLLAAYQGIVRRGGLHGLGVTIISQRPALVNKNALTQLDLLVLLRLVAGNDQEAVYKNYVSRATTKDEGYAIMDSLATLPVGTAIFFEPGAEPKRLVTAKVRERRTFNSSATPKPGQQRVEPSVLADVDLDKLREQMHETIERLKNDDPAELRKRITELRRLLDARQDGAKPGTPDAIPGWDEWFRGRGWLPPDEQPAPERIEVPIASIADLDAVWQLVKETKETGDSLVEGLREVTQPLAQAILDAAAAAKEPPPPAVVRPPVAPASPPSPAPRREPTDDTCIPRNQQKVLDGLAWWRAVGVEAPTRGQLAFVVGYGNAKSRGFIDPLYGLNAAGLTTSENGTVALTDEGLRYATSPEETPTEDAYQARVFSLLGPGHVRILRALIPVYPDAVPRADLAETVGYTNAKSRGFIDPLYRLRSLGLVEYPDKGTVRATAYCFLDRR